jgi:hypothetical protein
MLVEHTAQIEVIMVITGFSIGGKFQMGGARDNDVGSPFQARMIKPHGPAYITAVAGRDLVEEFELDLIYVGIEILEIVQQIIEPPDFMSGVDEEYVRGINFSDSVDVITVEDAIKIQKFIHCAAPLAVSED